MQALGDLPVEKLREIFEKYDTSGDGELDVFELKVFFFTLVTGPRRSLSLKLRPN